MSEVLSSCIVEDDSDYHMIISVLYQAAVVLVQWMHLEDTHG